jgi:uncharacterized protein with HEPN domain
MAAIDKAQLLMQSFALSPVDIVAAATPIDEYAKPPSPEQLAKIRDVTKEVAATAGKISILGEDVAEIADRIERDLHYSEVFQKL